MSWLHLTVNRYSGMICCACSLYLPLDKALLYSQFQYYNLYNILLKGLFAMSKKVLIISSSLRGGSNSECLARECERGAKDAWHDVQFISLKVRS